MKYITKAKLHNALINFNLIKKRVDFVEDTLRKVQNNDFLIFLLICVALTASLCAFIDSFYDPYFANVLSGLNGIATYKKQIINLNLINLFYCCDIYLLINNFFKNFNQFNK